jgi:hypothetical protein
MGENTRSSRKPRRKFHGLTSIIAGAVWLAPFVGADIDKIKNYVAQAKSGG